MANFLLRSITVLGSMYGILFGFMGIVTSFIIQDSNIVVASLSMGPWVFAILITFIFAFIQFLIAPWFLDLQLRWFYGLNWVSIDFLPVEMSNAMSASMQKYGYTIGKIGIIEDGTPNAFTYGRFRNGARIVFTRGIIDLLEPDERVGVLEHELAHILNGDFLFMTLAQMIPVLFYGLYTQTENFASYTSRISKGSSGRGKQAQQSGTAALYAIAAISYILWLISDYIVAYLSRLRETSADVRSAEETHNPNSLASALVKIAYGLVVADANVKKALSDKNTSRQDRTAASKQRSFMYGYRAMGISDIKTARGLVMTAYGGGAKEVDPEAVAAAASWDLSTPWAKYIELSSTHPLTGKRLKVLKDLASQYGQPPKYPSLGEIKPPESLWDEFLMDLFYLNGVPLLVFVLPIVGFIIDSIGVSGYLGTATGFVLGGILWLMRTNTQYPSVDNYLSPNTPKNTVLEALTSLEKDSYYEASPIRGKPIVIEGVVRGRGDPGYFLGDDFVVQDETGFIRVDFRSIFSLYGLWFGYKHVREMMGTKVRVVGWYHRSMAPYMKLYRLTKADGRIHKNRWRGGNRILSFILIGIGVALAVVGFV